MSNDQSTTHTAAGGVLVSIGAIQVLILLVALVRAKLLSLMLGPGGFGIVSTIDQTVVTIVSLGALSLPFTAMKFMARDHSDGAEAFRRTFATFLRALFALACVATAASVALLVLRPGLFGADLATYHGALLVALLGVPAAMLAILFVNTLAAAQRAAASALLNLATVALLATGAVVGERLGGIPGLYVGTAAAGVVATIGAVLHLRRTLGLGIVAHGTSLVGELRRSPEIVPYALLLYVAMAAYALTMLVTRYFVLSGLGPVQAGLLQSAFSLALSVGAVMTPMSNLFLAPLVNRRLPTEDKLRAADAFARKMVALMMLVALPIALFPRLVLAVLYSGKFAPAAGVLFVFILWQLVYQTVNVYLQLLIGLDDVPLFCLITCAAYACVVALFPPLIGRLGIGGVGAALAAGMLLAGVATAVRLRVRHGGTISRAVVGRAALSAGVIVVAGVLFGRSTSELTIGGAAARLAFASGALVVTWLVLDPAERASLRGAAATILRLRPLARPVAATPSARP